MSDNVGYTPGSGATIAADDCGGVLVQVVKLDIGADGVRSPVSGSLPVTTPRSYTSDVQAVAAAASNTPLLAANTARLGASVYNDADKYCYVKLGTTATTASFTVKVAPGGHYEVPAAWCGEVEAIWDAGPTGNALVTEIT